MHRRASRTAPISEAVDLLFWMVELSLANSRSVIGVNLELAVKKLDAKTVSREGPRTFSSPQTLTDHPDG